MMRSKSRSPTRRMVTAGALGLLAAPAVQAAPKTNPLVYVGTQGNEAGQGVFAARLDTATGKLTPIGVVAELARPTWIVADPDRPLLYAVSETGNDGKAQGKVHGLKADAKTGALTLVSTVDSGGGGPTHLALDAKGGGLLVAHYGSGHVAALPVRANGGAGAPASVQLDIGSGPSPRQKSAHAHGVALDPSGRYALVADLGADKVFVYPYDRRTRQLAPAAATTVSVPPGTGPRHMVFHPNGRFVFLISELVPAIHTYGWDASRGRLTELSVIRAGGEPPVNGAEIAVTREGRFVYASIRGEHVIVAFSVDQKTGALTELQRIASGGQTPWSFRLDPSERWLLAANQGSSTVTVLARDPATGRLSPTDQMLAVTKPTSLAFLSAH
jgi:6-phosphogluconolactonase